MRLQHGLQGLVCWLVLCLTRCAEARFGLRSSVATPKRWCHPRSTSTLCRWNVVVLRENLEFLLTRRSQRQRRSDAFPRWGDMNSSTAQNQVSHRATFTATSGPDDVAGLQLHHSHCQRYNQISSSSRTSSSVGSKQKRGVDDAMVPKKGRTYSSHIGVKSRLRCTSTALRCQFVTASPSDQHHDSIQFLAIRGGGGEANSTPDTGDHTRMNANATIHDDNPHSSITSNIFRDSARDHNEKDLDPKDKTSKSADYAKTETTAKRPTKPLLSWGDAPAKRRRLASLITDLATRSGGDGKALSVKSTELRLLIAHRRDECLNSILNADDIGILSHPKQLLHYLAPKIPAIRHSPDVGHRIRSARSDMDSGVAACLIGTLGYVSARYSSRVGLGSTVDSTARKIVQDRRFEQLIECILCAVDVRKRRKEWALMQQQHSDDRGAISAGVGSKDMETVVDEADFVEGLSIRDSCRAAWGIAVLRVHDVTTKLGGADIADLLIALLLRIRELLLARLKKLRHSDFFDEHRGSSGARTDVVSSIDERLLDYSDELAEDAATALWTTAAVLACTGIHCQPLVDVCCLILCTNPWDVRRQAQEVEATANSVTSMVGSNDIVERLALSEAEESTILNNAKIEPTSNMTTLHDEEVDECVSVLERNVILLEWLSPIQLVDTVWSLSVLSQGSENQAKLVEAYSTFQEIAFARILSWLTDGLTTSTHTEPDRSSYGVMFVDERGNVDAAGPDTPSATSEAAPLQHPIIAGATSDHASSDLYDPSEAAPGLVITVDTGLVELVDAEGLTALVSDHDIDTYTDSGESTSAPSIDMLDDETNRKHFSLDDFCAIAWAVTEVHDSLRGSITSSIVKTIVDGNPRTMAALSGGDIANLAWAIAKNTHTGADTTFAARIMELLVKDIMHERLGSLEISDLLTKFHPAELSRFLWSVASFQACFVGTFSWDSLDAVKLSIAALTTAAANTQAFCTEDLARLAWAFLSLSDPKGRFDENGVQQSLTKVLSIIEADLIRWETGKSIPYGEKNKNARPKRITVATEFSRFFRRALFHVPFLDSRLDVSNDESSEGDVSVNTEKPRRPPLKELPVDILTISKIACTCSRLELENGVSVSDTFTRIAVRLMVSHSSRLMRDCPIQDLARLCEAVARTKTPELKEVISLFSRRFVQHINGPGQAEVNSLGTCESIRLMWSLGELGVKCSSDGEDATAAHRRLRLATKLPLLAPTINAMDRVPVQELLQLLRSLTTMRIVDVDKALVLLCLSSLEKRVMLLDSKMQLCEAIISTELLRSTLEPASVDIIVPPERSMYTPNMGDHKGVASDDNKPILDLCDQIHTSMLARAVSVVTELQSQSLRSILMVVFNQRTPNSTAINAFDDEIKSRMTVMEHTVASARWDNATAALGHLQHILKGINKSENSATTLWLSHMRSYFGFSTDTSSERANEIHKQLHIVMESALHATAAAASPSVKATELHDLFEFGVCRRLIDLFRRDCSASDQLEGFDIPEAILVQPHEISYRFYP